MKLHFIHFLAILSLIVLEVASEKTKIKSVFPNRTSPPGLKSPRKCWWAKEITPDFHVSGRLTERQIKYAADCGFKSIVSLFTYPDNEPPSYFGGDYLPSTTEAKKVTEEIAGMKYINLLDPMDEWASVEAVFKMTKVLSVIPKPVLLHCDRGYTIAFVTLLYLANQTQHDPASTPKITSTDFYNITAAMGLNFVSRIPQEVVSEITGEPVFHDPPQVETEPEDWKDYWVAHPVYKNWYVGGQITKSHLPVMEETGFTSVINMRSGIILNGMPNQEEVNLLNIKSNTGTYASGDKAPRQHTSRLEETRIDPNRPNYFISPNSTVNYESRNYDEFGDEVGYQELTERLAFASSSLKYYHLPVGSDGPYTEYVNKVIDQFQDIGKKGPVFVHCASGKRAAHVAVLAAALQYDKDLEWALRRNQELGFDVSKKAEPEVYGIYVNWLNTSSSVSPFYDLMTYEDPPHVIAKKDGSGHEGLLVELVSLVSGKAGFSYSLRVLNESFGHKDSGRWSGLTRKMAEYSADMAVGAMVMSHADDDEVKYTEPFQTTSVQLLLPRPLAEVSPGAALLFVPFTATSWVLLIFAFVLVSLGLFLVGRFSPHEWGRLDPARDVRKARNSFGLKNSFLFVISTLTWQGYREAPRSLSGRVLAVSWWVFTLFILLAYTANLAAFVSSRPQTEPALSFRNFEDILQDRIVKIGMIRHGDVDLTLRMSTENLPKQLYEYVNARRNWVGNLEEGLERMRSSGRDFALMLPATKAQYLAARNCDLVAFGHGLVPISYAFAFSASRLSEPVKRRINSAILQLRQSGELYNLEQKWYSLGSKGCPDTDGNSLPVRRGETPPRFKAMDPQDLAMPFLLLFLCGLVTVGVAALEIMHAMGHFKLQKDEEEAAAEPFNTRAGPSAVDDKAELEDEEHPLKESPEKEMEDGKPDFEEELEPEEKEKRKEMKLYDDAAIKSDDDGTKAPASDIEKESD